MPLQTNYEIGRILIFLNHDIKKHTSSIPNVIYSMSIAGLKGRACFAFPFGS